MAALMSAAFMPINRGVVVSTPVALAWQPEQAVAPGGASAATAAEAIRRVDSPAATSFMVFSESNRAGGDAAGPV